MTLFHELYGAYFRIAARVLARRRSTKLEVQEIIQEEGFRDSVLFVPPRLLPQKDGSDWGLLREAEHGVYEPVTQHLPETPVTLLEKRWLRARLDDPRMGLFLDDAQIRALHRELAEIDPLWRPEDLDYTDRFADGDPYTDKEYRARFGILLAALQRHEVLDIQFTGRFGLAQRWEFLPLKLEYSGRDDKFRVHGWQLDRGGIRRSGVLNAARIRQIHPTGRIWQGELSMAFYFEERRCREPVTVRITPERNGVERFLMEFAFYEKKAERDLETGECTVRLWYDKMDETELLIRLLGYGPVLEILGPPAFRAQAAKRVAAQARLLKHPENS